MSESVPNAAYEAFREHSADLITVIDDPVVLAWELFGTHVISDTVADEVSVMGLSAAYKNARLLSAVRDQIKVDPTKLDTFLEALRKRQYMVKTAEKLEATYRMSKGLTKCHFWGGAGLPGAQRAQG